MRHEPIGLASARRGYLPTSPRAEREAEAVLDAGGFLTVREAGRLLALSRSTIGRMLAAGELPSVKVRAARRIPRAVVVALVAAWLSEEMP